ncbi:predicted protein [Enterococcus faecalis Fly1]|nr:predicted protein [Enterococcus faecalis Fly1]EEU82126.1 predicted protein [Enterococcus faecalis D6]EEU85167.1 predicted protein [Enterococcus faecalis CH188]
MYNGYATCLTGLFYAFFVVFTENVRITSAEEGHL